MLSERRELKCPRQAFKEVRPGVHLATSTVHLVLHESREKIKQAIPPISSFVLFITTSYMWFLSLLMNVCFALDP